jgi:predicted lipoprotein with Yx(FWY)xxD motif
MKSNLSKKLLVLSSLLLVFVLAACQPASVPVTGPVNNAYSPVKPTATLDAMPVDIDITLQVAKDAKLGDILVDGKGMTLYMFTKDEPNKSNCTGGCLQSWPPFPAVDEPVVGEGVDASLIGSADLADGSKILTYNGMPLYYWVNDTAPGQTSGQDVNQVWYVVSPDGKPVGNSPAAGEVMLKVTKDAALGDILVDGKGMTLYIFTKDEPNKSNCSGDCLVSWPPLLAVDNPNVGKGVNASLLGTADLPDGSKIVTYNSMPLYYWVNDSEPGQTSGQNVGGVWFVLSPDGKIIK